MPFDGSCLPPTLSRHCVMKYGSFVVDFEYVYFFVGRGDNPRLPSHFDSQTLASKKTIDFERLAGLQCFFVCFTASQSLLILAKSSVRTATDPRG